MGEMERKHLLWLDRGMMLGLGLCCLMSLAARRERDWVHQLLFFTTSRPSLK
jgi:hypothetical protein